jgi:type VI protein secretion system component VasF
MEEARRQLLQKLPPTGKISPNAHPRDRAQAVRVSRGPLIGLIAGCACLIIATLVGLHLSLQSNVDEAVQAMAGRTQTRH